MASCPSPDGSAAPAAAPSPAPPPPADCAGARESLCCPICCDVLLVPVVTPCGHAYCRDCFEVWRSHATAWPPASGSLLPGRLVCPLCRSPLPRSLAREQSLAPCAALADAISLLCPAALRERQHHQQQQLLEQKQLHEQQQRQQREAAAAAAAQQQQRRRLRRRGGGAGGAAAAAGGLGATLGSVAAACRRLARHLWRGAQAVPEGLAVVSILAFYAVTTSYAIRVMLGTRSAVLRWHASAVRWHGAVGAWREFLIGWAARRSRGSRRGSWRRRCLGLGRETVLARRGGGGGGDGGGGGGGWAWWRMQPAPPHWGLLPELRLPTVVWPFGGGEVARGDVRGGAGAPGGAGPWAEALRGVAGRGLAAVAAAGAIVASSRGPGRGGDEEAVRAGMVSARRGWARRASRVAGSGGLAAAGGLDGAGSSRGVGRREGAEPRPMLWAARRPLLAEARRG
ncbi:hypothetical protein PLESTB_000180500 [Pleodorina starrii]|uniref:RING-type domain-containing protein n=1 Tax=Pleodorina starrii TaxID=330485 RepID=A0A9W6EYH6_9CHLO|nr:hypothetical protein PLESTM_000516200 [Pleodorina starrii]GLC49081.1 hypothetical protein PLESTB_000180500 [Pleodorina starrii]GLC66123.1 hypothetical protein PLESTF_000387200 [Pleodorina starrii]